MRRITLYLFATALAVRLLLSLIRATHGLTFTSLWLEGKDDFDGIYVQQLSLMRQGEIPYQNFADSYPPLFLYSLYPFYLAGGANWASLPIVVSDAASAVVILLCVERLAGTRMGLAAGLVYAFTPFALYYEGYVWFSSQPMAFFAILGFYFLLAERPVLSLSSLAVAVLFKQEALCLLPAYLGYVAYRNRGALAKSLSAFGVLVIGVSAPFLATAAYDYLSLVSYGLLGRWPGAPAPEKVLTTAVCQSVGLNAAGTVMSCLFGTTNYTEVVNNTIAPSTQALNALTYDVEVIAGLVVIPLLLLMVPVLFSLRRHKAFMPLVCAFSTVGFLVLFSIVFHPVYRYYYLPAYMFIVLASSDRKTLTVAAASTVLSLLTPSGMFQELLPVLCILAMSALLDSSTASTEVPIGSHDWP